MEKLFGMLESPIIWLSNQTLLRKATISVPVATGLGHDVESDDVFDLGPSDLARHAYILGSTGCGKTSLILKLIEKDLLAQQSIVILDMRGDLITGALSLCESKGIDPNRVTLLDLRDKEFVQGFNPLAGAGEPFIRALHVLDVLAEEAASWGVQLEETLRSALLVLAEAKEPLTKIAQLFYDPAFRTKCLSRSQDEDLIAFWDRYDALKVERQQTWALPVLNKVTSLLAVPNLRKVLDGNPSLELGDVLNRKGSVLLVSLAVDEFHRSSRMLGSLIVSAISREVLSRVDVPERSRNPVRLYVDEFENMASESFESLIAEGRRFKLSLVLSHQTLSQLQNRLRSVIRNNVGLQLIFQCGFEDAKTVSNELPNDLGVAQIRELEVGQAIVMTRDGEAQTVQFDAPPKLSPPKRVAEYRRQVLSKLRPTEPSRIDEVDKTGQLDLGGWL